MKVLQINATYGVGSTGLIVRDIASEIEKEGGQAYFAYQKAIKHVQNGYQVGNPLDWKIHALLCRIFGKQAYFSKWATKKLIKYIAKIKPDVIHLHNLHSNYVNLKVLIEYIAQNDFATVITLHDCWFFTGKCFHYADIGCNGFMKNCENCPKKKERPQSLFYDRAKDVLNDKITLLKSIPRLHLVGCSKWICNELKKSRLNGVEQSQIYNGVDVDIFKSYDNSSLREKYGLNDSTYVIMGMANKWLLPSNKKILKEVKNTLNENKKFMIIGCTEKQKQLLKNMSEYFIPIGFIKHRELIAKHYSLADVFVNVSHADTLPTVVMESICCGTKVIAYDSCGCAELVLEGCGTIVKENDTETILKEIDKQPSKIQEKYLQKAREIFNKNKCYKKYLQVYIKTLSQKD